MFKISKIFNIKAVQDLKKEPKSKKSEVKPEDMPEDNHNGLFEVYDLRDSDLEKIEPFEFTNSVLFFSSGDFVEELKQFEEALDRQDGIFNMKPRKYFNFFVITNNQCSPMLKTMVTRGNGLEDLKYPFPILLDVHGKLGTHFKMFDDEKQKEVSCFIGIGIKGGKLFELKNFEKMDAVAEEILKCLEQEVEVENFSYFESLQ